MPTNDANTSNDNSGEGCGGLGSASPRTPTAAAAAAAAAAPTGIAYRSSADGQPRTALVARSLAGPNYCSQARREITFFSLLAAASRRSCGEGHEATTGRGTASIKHSFRRVATSPVNCGRRDESPDDETVTRHERCCNAVCTQRGFSTDTKPTLRRRPEIDTVLQLLSRERHGITLCARFFVIPAKARDYVFTGVRLSVCLSVCLFVCYHDN